MNLEFTSEQHAQFAKLSGDFNPLHTDPEFARRSQFGTTVVHGVHVVLRVLEHIASIDSRSLRSLLVEFRSPVKPDLDAKAEIMVLEKTASVRVIQDDLVATKLNLEFGTRITSSPIMPNVDRSISEKSYLNSWEQNVVGARFVESVGHVHSSANKMFPKLVESNRQAEIDVLLAITRVIGMKCPGRYALLRSLTLKSNETKQEGERCLTVARVDSRLRIVHLALNSAEFSGVVQAHHRRPRVRQSIDSDKTGQIGKNSFSGVRALIIGGSQGLGELATRILVAGGAQVLATYRNGKTDCESIRDELGGSVKITQLDVLNPGRAFLETTRLFAPSHLLYFASPKIAFRGAAPWNERIYREFLDFYVSRLAWATSLAKFAGVYAPSSTFVTTQQFGYREYIKSKLDMERFCELFRVENPQCTVICDRLPPLLTDQTVDVLKSGVDENVRVLAPSLMNLLQK